MRSTQSDFTPRWLKCVLATTLIFGPLFVLAFAAFGTTGARLLWALPAATAMCFCAFHCVITGRMPSATYFAKILDRLFRRK